MKPIVYYETVLSKLEVGESAWILRAYNHPTCHGEKYLITSPVVKDLGNGEFETMNTIYKPAKVNNGI